MKNSLRLSPVIFFLFGFLLNSPMLTAGIGCFGLEVSENNVITSADFTSSAITCSTPAYPNTTNITQSSATLNWAPVGDALSYSVQIHVPNGSWSDVPGSPCTNTWIIVNGLNMNTVYEWRVQSNCSGGQYSNWTNPVAFITSMSSSCNAPDWLNTINILQTTATWNWSPVNGAVNYSIQWRYPGGNWYYLSGGPWYSTWLNIGGLQPSTTYEWRVQSNCGNGMYSPWSAITSFTTLGSSCNTATWPTTSNVTQTSATFTWDPVWGAQSYTVQTRLLNGSWYDVPGSPVSGTWITINGLDPNTTYQWRVRTNCGYGQYSYWTNPITFTTLGMSCYAPTGLYTTNITQTTATLNWSLVSGAANYSLQWRYPNGYWYDLPGGPWSGSWHTITGLTPGTAYEWRVRSNCYNGMYSYWSYSAYFTTLGSSCNTPTWPTTSNITQTSATFSWDEVWGAQNYTVQSRLPNGTWYDVPGSPVSGTWITINGLNPNTTYQWRVRANCGYGQYSYWTNPVTFTTLGMSCYAPTGLYTTNITQTSATLNWSLVSGAANYSLQWRYPNGTWYDVPGGPWSGSWYTLTGLTPGTSYEWRVRSNCYNGMYSYWSYSAYFTTLGSSCNTPTWPTTSNITQTSATFSWDEVWGAQNYTVQSRLPNGTWYDVPGSPVSGTWVTINGLNPNTTYQWRVRANCGYGQYSYWTEPITFTTLGMSCYAPTGLYTTNITQTSATLNWSLVSGAANYSLQWRYPNGTWYDVPGGPWSGSWYTLAGLTPGTAYEWRVRSNCYNGMYSYWSYSAYFTTLGSSCNTPTWPTTSNITQTSATFSWDEVWGAQNYTVQTRLLNGTWYDAPGSPFANSTVTVGGFSPNTTYQWRVRANCGGGQYSNWTSPITFTTLGGWCESPIWLATFVITQTSANWAWSSVSGAASYSIQWRYPNGTWYYLSGGPFTNTNVDVGGLQPNTTYEWRVQSNCYNGMTSDWSYITSFTTLGYSCNTPTWPVTSNITQTSANFSWDAVSGAVNYSVQTRLPNGTWYDVAGSPFTNTSVTVYGLSPNTTYEWRVRANCGGGQYSNWTSPISFTTSGSNSGNDNCINATVLPVNSTCVPTLGSNIGATPSTPPPVGGCFANNYKDVWFKFTMPNVFNAAVTIRTTAGSLADGVMEVYVGTSCSDLFYLTCEDDNTNGNNSPMPVISVTGNPGATIWVRVWGYNGTTGTFNICVFDYLSVNYTGVVDSSVDPASGEQIDPEIHTKAQQIMPEKVNPGTLSVFPNPANDLVMISYSQTEMGTVSAMVISDLSGKIILHKDYRDEGVHEFHEQVDVSGYIPGIYILQLKTSDGIITEKLSIIQH